MLGSITSIKLFKSDVISRRALRYAIGMVIMFAIVFLINWPMSFLFIVFGSGFLLGTKPPGWKVAFGTVLKFVGASLASIVMCYLFIDFYLLYILVVALIMLHIFYAKDSVLDHTLKFALPITFVVIPLMWLKSPMISFTVATYLSLGMGLALLLAIIMFELMPDIPVSGEQAKAAHGHGEQKQSDNERFRLALKSLTAVLPIIILFNMANLHGHLLIIVFVAVLAGHTGFANNSMGAKIMVKTTFFGGVVAIFMYEILVIVPNFTFFMLMIFGLALYGAHQILSGGKHALNIQKGLAAIIIIFVGVASAPDSDVEAKMWTRVFQMTIVVIYMIINFRLFDMFFPPTQKNQNNEDTH